MEALVGVLTRLLPAGTIDTGPLPRLLRRLMDLVDCALQLVVHDAVQHRMADVVSEVKGPDEQTVDAGHGGDLVDVGQCLSRLDLHNSHQGVIGLGQVVGGANGRRGVELFEGEGAAEASGAFWRELGAADELLHVVDGVD